MKHLYVKHTLLNIGCINNSAEKEDRDAQNSRFDKPDCVHESVCTHGLKRVCSEQGF